MNCFQIIKDWMLVIIVAGIVGLELIVMLVGTAIPESRITARPVLVDELRQNVSIIDRLFYRVKIIVFHAYVDNQQAHTL